jgi:hypothetical protein
VTDQTSPTEQNVPSSRAGVPLGRTLLWLGLAGTSAAVTFFLVRAVITKNVAPSDETAERIQELIDEANRLIKTLDEKKHA